MLNPVRRSSRGVVVDVLVQPNARRSEVVGRHGDRIKVRVTAAPRRLAANAAVEALLAEICGVRRADVVTGRTTRHKTVELVGGDLGEVKAALDRPSKAR